MAEPEPDAEYIEALTAKQIKKLARPEFAANPDKFYPTETLRGMGFSRAQCPVCDNFFWRHTETRVNCGDSNCEGKYSFIGVGTGIGKGPEGKKISYGDAWQGFKKSLSSTRVPCTPIDRYPVVARWRADVDYVAAGIFCFQPYCVTGELEPPANPLICPQFCLRFNDLDNIGMTGRHFSGFIMLGIQVFNSPNNYKFWSGECVEFNYRWLTEELGIDPDEITFIEDVWAGGGNLGPSIEYFVNGLELGNMVFMQFKTFPDGRREPLQVQVIDVGIGLERVPWLINGSATSYMDIFPSALEYFLEKTGISINNEVWEKFGPLSCLLNVDEVEDIDATWEEVSGRIGIPVEEVKAAIDPMRNVYVVLDHTRTILMAIEDGSLPSNVGGASNVRNILRRVFAIMHKNGWWEVFGMEGFLEIFKLHKIDLAQIYGEFKHYPSFAAIIELEYARWSSTDDASKSKLQKLVKKRKGKLTLDDWIVCITSWGIPADSVTAVVGEEVPGNLWYTIAERQEKMVKAEAAILYSTAHLKGTESLYFKDHHQYQFEATILEVMPNVTRNFTPSIVILDQSSFYPTSGGQEHDTGSLTIDGVTYAVVDALKVGPCVLHVIEPPLPADVDLDTFKGKKITGEVDVVRRSQLRNNHTSTHIVFASCRHVLGPHVWQNGAKKNIHQAHLDITHFKSITHEQQLAIENEANRIVSRCKDITKGFMAKDEAEKEYGFSLYQGGIVPGNELRVVSIADTDTEACCGTHCDNTAEVGNIKIIKTARISDGIVRLYFVAGENALKLRNGESQILNGLTSSWGITQDEIQPTAQRFFDGYKKFSTVAQKQATKILELQMKVHLLDPSSNFIVARSDESSPTMFISNMPQYAEKLKEGKKGVIFVGPSYLYGLIGVDDKVDSKALEEAVSKMQVEAKSKKAPLRVKNKLSFKSKDKKQKKKITVTGVVELTCFSVPDPDAVVQMLVSQGFTLDEC